MGDSQDGYDYAHFADVEPWYIWVLNIAVASLNFWLQAAVTEDRFVPALNVIATYFDVPDDVAGATLMAGGASTPELFGSFIALFVTHSALGIGTIVGSGIFNQLVICAGAVLAARGDELQLDAYVLMREAGFYGLSIIFLLYALSQKEIVDDDVEYEPHIVITPFLGGLLISGYILYVLVCYNFEVISSKLKSLRKADDREDPTKVGYSEAPEARLSRIASLSKIEVPDLPFLRHVKDEPKRNFHENLSTSGCSRVSTTDGKDYCTYELETSRPSNIYGLEDVEKNETNGTTSCFMWQQSFFYNKARIDVNAWQLRWFTISDTKIKSMSDRAGGRSHSFKYPTITKVEADEDHLLLKLHRKKHHKRPFILLAPNAHVLSEVMHALDKHLQTTIPIKENEAGDGEGEGADETKNLEDNAQDNTDELNPEKAFIEEVHHSLIAFPHDGTTLTKIMFFLLFPFNFAMHITIPDVRTLTSDDGKLPIVSAIIAIVACIIWLIGSSYVLVESLEEIGRLLNIPHAIVGITISAAGTSVANFVASQCAAKQGMGNMAVSNAFGSNIFIIFVGLGLPWFTYTITEQSGGPYYKIRDEGLTLSVLMMAVVLVAFMILMWWNDFILRQRHAYVFCLGYVLYVGVAIVQSFFHP